MGMALGRDFIGKTHGRMDGFFGKTHGRWHLGKSFPDVFFFGYDFLEMMNLVMF